MAAAAAGVPAIDRAIAKLDAILLTASGGGGAGAGGVAGATQAAAGGSVKPVPSSAGLSSTSSSRPSTASATSAAAAAAGAGGGREVLATKAQIKVARITAAQRQPNSEKLLKLQADLGEGDARQIMAGLAPYFPDPEVLVGRLVVVAANLKPAKLAGEPSQAMVLAADTKLADGTALVKPLVPPEHARPGDVVHLDGASPPAAYPKVLKLDEWRAVVPGLVVRGGNATYEGTPLVTSRGLVTLPPEMPDGAEIH